MSLKSVWINFLYKSATGSKKVKTILTPIGGLIYGIFTFMFIIGGVFMDKLLGAPIINLGIWTWIISLTLLSAGIFFVGWSVLFFKKSKGTPVPANPPPILVTNGPYAYTRNPMLSGMFMLLLGIGFIIGSISLITIFTPLYILLNVLELKLIEEPELVKRLGKKYIEYKEQTPMFIPFVKLL